MKIMSDKLREALIKSLRHSGLREYPQRQLGDCSDTAYPRELTAFPNTPSGSWGMIQIQPQAETQTARLNLNNPPAAAGGILKSNHALSCRLYLNDPPTSVGGIKQIQNVLLYAWFERSFDCHPALFVRAWASKTRIRDPLVSF
jgi:hypothetical protein